MFFSGWLICVASPFPSTCTLDKALLSASFLVTEGHREGTGGEAGQVTQLCPRETKLLCDGGGSDGELSRETASCLLGFESKDKKTSLVVVFGI